MVIRFCCYSPPGSNNSLASKNETIVAALSVSGKKIKDEMKNASPERGNWNILVYKIKIGRVQFYTILACYASYLF